MTKTRIVEVELINGKKKYYPQKKRSLVLSMSVLFLLPVFPFGTMCAILIGMPFAYEHFGFGEGYNDIEEAKARIDRYIKADQTKLGEKTKSKKYIKYP